MKLKLKRYALLVVLLGSGYLPAQDPMMDIPVVSTISIRHLGPAAASDSLVRAHIRTREGLEYSPNTLDEDVRNLYKTGFFQRVSVTRDPQSEGVSITYVLQGKPIVTDMSVEGNDRYSVRRIFKEIDTVVGEPIDDRKLFFDAKAIEEFYQKKGYYDVNVEVEKQVNDLSGRGSITFVVKEGPKIKIDDIIFNGVEGYKQKELRKVLETKRTWWLAWLTGDGKLKRDVLDDDREQLTSFFRNEGFLDVEVLDLQIEPVNENRVVLVFTLEQRQKYQTGDISFSGNTLFSNEELEKSLVMQQEDVFSPKGFAGNRTSLYDMYDSKGYIDARIGVDQNPNVTTGLIDLKYDIIEGEQSYIDRILIQGNTRTKDKVIRRYLAVDPGDVYDNVRVRVSKTRLERLNLFSSVEMDPVDTDVDSLRDLSVTVTEQSTGNITFGAGFSTVDNIVGFVEFNERNFDIGKWSYPYLQGGGQKFRARAQAGARRKDFSIRFIEPWFMDQKLEFQTDLFHRDLNFQSDEYRETRTGGRFTFTRPILESWVSNLRGSVGYAIERVNLDFETAGITRAEAISLQNKLDNNIPLTAAEQAILDTGRHTLVSPDLESEENGTRWTSKALAGIAYDTRRGDPLFPTYGTLTKLDSSITGGPFGLDTDFYSLEAKSYWYFPGIFSGQSIQVKAELGVMESFGESDNVPLFDRFFLGGAYNMRGFDYREIGPRDTFLNGEPIGGNTYWQGTVEYVIPLIENLKFAVFYDIGNVYSDAYAFDQFGEFSDNWGVGFRLQTPLGPLQLDYGMPISDNDGYGRDDARFQFGVTIRDF